METLSRSGHLCPGGRGAIYKLGGQTFVRGSDFHLFIHHVKVIDEDKRRKMEFLQNLGRENQDDVVEFSLKFYYTNQVKMIL